MAGLVGDVHRVDGTLICMAISEVFCPPEGRIAERQAAS
jgi:hypothetical protein